MTEVVGEAHREVVGCVLSQGEVDDDARILVGHLTATPCPVTTHYLDGHALSHHPLILDLDGKECYQVGGHSVVVHLNLDSISIGSGHQVFRDVTGSRIEGSTLGYCRHRIH